MAKIRTKKEAERWKFFFEVVGFALCFLGLITVGAELAGREPPALGLALIAIGMCELIISTKYAHLLGRHGDELE